MKSGMRSSGLARYSATAASVTLAAVGKAGSARSPAIIRARRGRSSRRSFTTTGRGRASPLLDALRHDLGEILHLESLLGPGDLATEIDHGETEGAGHADHVGLDRERLLDADEVDALVGLGLHP